MKFITSAVLYSTLFVTCYYNTITVTAYNTPAALQRRDTTDSTDDTEEFAPALWYVAVLKVYCYRILVITRCTVLCG